MTATKATDLHITEFVAYTLHNIAGERTDDAGKLWRNSSQEYREGFRKNAAALLEQLDIAGVRVKVGNSNKLIGALDVIITEPARAAYQLGE